MAVSPGEVIRVSARMRNSVAGDIVNVFHWIHAGDEDVADDLVLAEVEAKLNSMFDGIAPWLTNTSALFDIKVDVVAFVGGKLTTIRPIGIVPWNGAGAPSGSGEAMPEGVAAIINMSTSSPGVLGRKYIGIPTEGAVVNGDITSGFGSELLSFIGALLLDLVVDTEAFQSGVMSKKLSGFVSFVEGVVRGYCGYQRRRTRRRGS